MNGVTVYCPYTATWPPEWPATVVASDAYDALAAERDQLIADGFAQAIAIIENRELRARIEALEAAISEIRQVPTDDLDEYYETVERIVFGLTLETNCDPSGTWSDGGKTWEPSK